MDAEAARTPLRVLCIEDSAADVELLRERLVAEFELTMRVATNAREFTDALAAQEYDVIIADYTLPDLDAPSALEAVHSAGIDTPFICVSGTVGEDRTVELLKRGAVDYVLKDRMGRLGFAIRRAVQSAGEKAELKASQERFQQLFENAGDAIIVHDDEIILANPAAHWLFGYPADFDMTGIPIERLIHPDWVKSTHAALARLRAGEDAAVRIESQLVRADGTTWFGEVTISSLVADGRTVFEATLHDLTLRRRREQELETYRDQLEQLADERGRSLEVARSALASVTSVISRTVEIRDPYTAGHQRRVTELATAIARQLQLPSEAVEEISVAASIHDIGKVSIPAEVLSKPGRLSDPEYELVKTHSQAGFDIISSAHLGGSVAEIVLQHHERCDGSGYPQGLVGEQIMTGAKIIMVADVVEAMSSHRPYRSALGIDAARVQVAEGSGSMFDPVVAQACLDVLDAGFAFEDAQM